MKRLLKSALCSLLVLALLTPTAIAQEKINQNIYVTAGGYVSEQKIPSALAVIGDAVYVLAGENTSRTNTLERWKQSMDAPEILLDKLTAYERDAGEKPLATNISRLFSDGTALYSYNNDTGDVFILLDAAGKAEQKPLYKLDISEISVEADGYTDVGSTLALFVQEGVLYLLNQNDSREDGMALAQYDFATGELLKLERNQHLREIAPYKEGQLLCLWQEKDDVFDEETQQAIPNSVAIFDPKTAAASPIVQTAQWGDTGLCYDAATNTAYYVSGTKIYSLPNLQPMPRISAYLPIEVRMGDPNQAVGILAGGNFVIGNYDGLYVRGLDIPGIENGALSIMGEYGGSQRHKAVVAKHPELAMALVNNISNNMESLTAAIISGEDAVDIMLLNSLSAPLTRMIDKGYAADLGVYPELMAVINRMDPRFVEALQKDGKFYGLPVGINGNGLGYNKTLWEETLGLAESDLPKTFVELLDFAANFYADYGEDHPDVNLMSDPNMRQTLRNALMDSYVAYEMKTGGIVAFDTPLFRKLLAALDAIGFKEIDPYAVNHGIYADGEAMNEFYEKQALFTFYIDPTKADSFGQSRDGSIIMPLVLALDAGMEPVIPVYLDVMILNPRSRHMEQAGVYLSVYAQHGDRMGGDIALFPSEAKAIANPYFESNKKQIQEDVVRMKAQIEAAGEENKADLRESLKSLQGWLKDADSESMRMLITDDMIARYLAMAAPYLYVMRQTPLTGWADQSGNELGALMIQYEADAIDTDTFIREIDKRVKMMMLEDS